MNHEEFLAFIMSLLGPRPNLESRENLGNLIRSKGTRIYLKWSWMVKNKSLESVDGKRLEVGMCNDDGIELYTPKEET